MPRLEAYFADQADRVAQRLRAQAQGAAGLVVQVHVQAKKDYPFGADDLMPGSEDAGLRVILNPHVLSAAESGWEVSADEFALDAAFDVDNPQVSRLLSTASSERVRGIADHTRRNLRYALDQGAERGYSVYQLANGVPGDDYRGIRSMVEESYRGRAETIARTEIAWGSNQGATALYDSEGVTHVEVLDGLDWDAPCQAANGQTWTLERAKAEPLAHPNCQRAFAPLVEKPDEVPGPEGRHPPAAGDLTPEAREGHLMDVMGKVENRIRFNSTESAYIYDDAGELILKKRGSRNTVGFTYDEMRQVKGARVMTHNHPSGGSFSPADIDMACQLQAGEMRACGRDVIFSMKPPEGTMWDAKLWEGNLRTRVNLTDAKVRQELTQAIQDGSMTISQANTRHWDEVWTRVAGQTGLRYTKVVGDPRREIISGG